jgi:hypothetical protein
MKHTWYEAFHMQSPATSSLLGWNIFLALFSDDLCLRDQVSHLYKTYMAVLYILIKFF